MDLEPEVWFRKELLSVMITELAKITENHETHVLTVYYVLCASPQNGTLGSIRHCERDAPLLIIIPELHLYQINSQQNDYTHTYEPKAKRLSIPKNSENPFCGVAMTR